MVDPYKVILLKSHYFDFFHIKVILKVWGKILSFLGIFFGIEIRVPKFHVPFSKVGHCWADIQIGNTFVWVWAHMYQEKLWVQIFIKSQRKQGGSLDNWSLLGILFTHILRLFCKEKHFIILGVRKY